MATKGEMRKVEKDREVFGKFFSWEGVRYPRVEVCIAHYPPENTGKREVWVYASDFTAVFYEIRVAPLPRMSPHTLAHIGATIDLGTENAELVHRLALSIHNMVTTLRPFKGR